MDVDIFVGSLVGKLVFDCGHVLYMIFSLFHQLLFQAQHGQLRIRMRFIQFGVRNR